MGGAKDIWRNSVASKKQILTFEPQSSADGKL